MRIENITDKELELMIMGITYVIKPKSWQDFTWEVGTAFQSNFPGKAKEVPDPQIALKIAVADKKEVLPLIKHPKRKVVRRRRLKQQ